MQENDDHSHPLQLSSKDGQQEQVKEKPNQSSSSFNISSLLNQEPPPQQSGDESKSAQSTPTIDHNDTHLTQFSPRDQAPQANMQTTSFKPQITPLTFHQYEPPSAVSPVAAEATVKRLPLRKRLTLETKVQQQQQHYARITSPTSAEFTTSPLSAGANQTTASISQPNDMPLDGDTTETDEVKNQAEIILPPPNQVTNDNDSQSPVIMRPLKKAKTWNSKDSSSSQMEFASMQSQFQITPTPSPALEVVKREMPDDNERLSNKRLKSMVDSPPMRDSKPVTSEVLYCICRKPYDRPRFMIACDDCDQWFHGECVGISERDGALVEKYFCPSCARETGKQMSWKQKCANPACSKPARMSNKEGVISKYCSGDCGLLLARAKITNCDMKRRAVLEDGKFNATNGPKIRSTADIEDRKLLVNLREQQLELEKSLAHADLRARFLKLVIRRQQEYKSDDVAIDEAKGMKSKRIDEGGICGFDSRLLWEVDETWTSCLDKDDDDAVKRLEQGQFKVCLNSRKCQQHAQWQKLKAAEIELERSEDIQAMAKLKKERHQAKVRMKHRRENVSAVVNNGVIDHTLPGAVASR